MKLGLGLYRHQLDDAHFRFAAQAGCEALVIHLVDYFQQGAKNRPGNQPTGDLDGWGCAGNPDRLWGRMIWIKSCVAPRRMASQLPQLKTWIRRIGQMSCWMDRSKPANWRTSKTGEVRAMAVEWGGFWDSPGLKPLLY